VRSANGLLIAGVATAEHGGDTVVVGQPLDASFAAGLKRTLQAEVAVTVGGRTVAATFTGAPPARDVYPARVTLATPGGGEAVATMYVPAAEVYRARRTGLFVALGGGVLLLAAAFAFYGYAMVRITRPIGDLIAATGRLAAGDLSGALAADAPAELGQLVREFNRMAVALKAAQDTLVHSAKLSSVGALVAGVSHELNNPLYGLLGHAEHLASKFPEGDPVREKLDIVVREARRMQRTLADLRGFTRPSARERGRVDLGQVASEVLALVKHDAETAKVACHAEPSSGPAVVNGSPDELRQIVLNLVLNSFQAMPQGGTLTVAVAGPGADRRCRVTVTDTGSGMAPDTLARVREPFFSTKPGRMGLGLSIAQELAAAHQGTLEIESRPGAGTRITVVLPAWEDQS
jgi:signal transduction histidine kinase